MLECTRNRCAKCDSRAIVHGGAKQFDVLLDMEKKIRKGDGGEILPV